MHRFRRLANPFLAVLLATALLAPAALAAAPTTTGDTGPAGWWSWVTTQVVHVVNALGPGWDPDTGEGDGAGTTSGSGEDETVVVTGPDVGGENELGAGWDPDS